MNNATAQAFIEESKTRAKTSQDRINHCLAQLEDEDMWWAPDNTCNCIGIIIQHLIGNLRQWIISGVGGEPDIRDRPREFRIEDETAKSELQKGLNQVLGEVIETYAQLKEDALLEVRTIQGFERTVLGAIYGTMTHLELHAGQITLLTRLRIGSRYREYWKPANKEQRV
jgi:hypothetical protein